MVDLWILTEAYEEEKEDGNDKEEDLLNPLPVGNFNFSFEQATWFEHNTPALVVDMVLIFMLAWRAMNYMLLFPLRLLGFISFVYLENESYISRY